MVSDEPLRSIKMVLGSSFTFLLISSHSFILTPFIAKILSFIAMPALAAAEPSAMCPTLGASLSTPINPSKMYMKNAKIKLKNGPAKRM